MSSYVLRRRKRYCLLYALGASVLGISSLFSVNPVEVGVATIVTPPNPDIDIKDPDKFLNDLKLSPYWSVTKSNEGTFRACARVVVPLAVSNREDGTVSASDSSGGRFLFQVMTDEKPILPEQSAIRSSTLELENARVSLSVSFGVPSGPPERTCIDTWGENAALRIFESWAKKVDVNSQTTLALKVSSAHDIYLYIDEQGNDKAREATARFLKPVRGELKRLAELPADYHAAKVYQPFFRLVFKSPIQASHLGRYPGLQDRDTFYGCFRSRPGISYEGINIKISHPIYCLGEGTRESSRLGKAQYLGKPHHDGDLLFYLIDDNAVYLAEDRYDKLFGTFSGTQGFDGTLEVLNADGQVLLETTEKFRGWER